MKSRIAAAIIGAAATIALAGCTGPADPPTGTPSRPSVDPDDGATVDDYCWAVHIVFDVTAQTTDDGVVVGWTAQGNDLDDVDYRVYRRPAGTDTWAELADVTIEGGADQAYLDTAPADPPGTYEYTVTRLDPLCGGESEICDGGTCDPAPTATPLPD